MSATGDKRNGKEGEEHEEATAAEVLCEQAQGSILLCWEGSKLTVPSGAEHIQRAWYGDPDKPWLVEKGCGADCTEVVARLMKAYGGTVPVSNPCLNMDPAPGIAKVLLVELSRPVQAVIEEIAFPRTFGSLADVPSAPRWLAFVRHAQAGHNIDKARLLTQDNPLTEHGCEQAAAARESLAGEVLRSAELVITSPLMRAMQTTALLLGEDDAGVRVMVHPLHSERWSAPCDEGTPKSELLQTLPSRFRDWEGWDTLEERWWPEPGEDAYARMQAFVASLRERPEERIAFVGHGAFWHMTLGRFLGNVEAVCCERFLA